MQEASTITLATLNVWNWDVDLDERMSRIGEWVRASSIDVLCVQEAAMATRGSLLDELSTATGLALTTPRSDESGFVPVGVLSNLPALEGEVLDLGVGTVTAETRCAALSRLHVGDGDLLVASVHLAWGGTRELVRLAQAKLLVSVIDERLGGDSDAPAIIAGDFNTPEDAETLRYFTGRSAHEPGTFWTDAWDARVDRKDDGDTSAGDNLYVQEMARRFRPGDCGALMMGMLPDRRIDFILSRGWRYGRAFSPSATEVVREPLMSDHYALVTHLLIPPSGEGGI